MWDRSKYRIHTGRQTLPAYPPKVTTTIPVLFNASLKPIHSLAIPWMFYLCENSQQGSLKVCHIAFTPDFLGLEEGNCPREQSLWVYVGRAQGKASLAFLLLGSLISLFRLQQGIHGLLCYSSWARLQARSEAQFEPLLDLQAAVCPAEGPIGFNQCRPMSL